MIIERFRNLIQVVESRIELFDKLRDFVLLEKSDLDPVIECLTVSSILHLDAYVSCLIPFYMLFDAVFSVVFCCLNNKLDILGRLHLLGYIPVLVKQVYFECGYEICRFRIVWMFSTVSCSWDKGRIPL